MSSPYQWIGLVENLQENPIFNGKNQWVSGSDFPLNQSIDLIILNTFIWAQVINGLSRSNTFYRGFDSGSIADERRIGSHMIRWVDRCPIHIRLIIIPKKKGRWKWLEPPPANAFSTSDNSPANSACPEASVKPFKDAVEVPPRISSW